MRENLEIWDIYFQGRILEIFTRIEDIVWNVWKILKNSCKLWRNLLKILEEVLNCEELMKIISLWRFDDI